VSPMLCFTEIYLSASYSDGVFSNSAERTEMYFNQVEFGQRVKTLRKKEGFTVEQMADELNISYEHYKKIENGTHGCSIALLLDISTYFDVSTDYLLMGTTFQTLHIQKQLSRAQEIIEDIMKDLR